MKPLKFKEQTTIVAKGQPQYGDLPAFIEEGGMGQVVFCMGLGFWERIQVLITGRIWVSLCMFGKDVTPTFFTVYKDEILNTDSEHHV